MGGRGLPPRKNEKPWAWLSCCGCGAPPRPAWPATPLAVAMNGAEMERLAVGVAPGSSGSARVSAARNLDVHVVFTSTPRQPVAKPRLGPQP